MMNSSRARLLELYAAGLRAVHGTALTRQWLASRELAEGVDVVAIGKAAPAMLEGAVAVLGQRLHRALGVTRQGYLPPSPETDSRLHWIEAGHPVPDAASLEAGRRLLELLEAGSDHADLVILISGGASSLVEVPVEGMDLDVLRRMNAWLLASGLDIGRINAIRKAVSRIKGGRLARWLGDRRVHCALLSDVPGDDPASIGSGLLVPDTGAAVDMAVLPDWLRGWVERAPPAPAAGEACFANIDCRIVGRLEDAVQAVAEAARARGIPATIHPAFLDGDAADTGVRVADTLLDGQPGIHVWGGETTLTLPAEAGRGGRSQHLALAAAARLRGHPECWLLAAGTDGSDGPTTAAGALVDGGTVERGGIEGFSAEQSLQRADSYTFLEASGDLIETGPTGTNVMDLVIGYRCG